MSFFGLRIRMDEGIINFQLFNQMNLGIRKYVIFCLPLPVLIVMIGIWNLLKTRYTKSGVTG